MSSVKKGGQTNRERNVTCRTERDGAEQNGDRAQKKASNGDVLDGRSGLSREQGSPTTQKQFFEFRFSPSSDKMNIDVSRRRSTTGSLRTPMRPEEPDFCELSVHSCEKPRNWRSFFFLPRIHWSIK